MTSRLLPLLLVCLTASAAGADGFYYSESMGVSHVKDELGAYMPNASFRARIGVGVRRGDFAVEGYFAGDMNPDVYTNNESDLASIGLDVKYLRPLARHLDVYLRGGLSHAWADGALNGYDGRGLGFGAGLQIKGKVPAVGFLFWPLFFTNWGPKVTAALFVDEGYDFYRLHQDGDLHGPAIDAQVTHFTGGFSVGTDF